MNPTISKAKYRSNLPQLSGAPFLTDGGIETTLIFHDGFDLPEFAAFVLFNDPDGLNTLRNYFRSYAAIAQRNGVGFILESATWRASADWAAKLNYSTKELVDANIQAINLLVEVRDELETAQSPMVISGCIGPRGDGYDPGTLMSEAEAEQFHSEQINTFAAAGADMVTAITMTNIFEAIGLTRAAQAAGMPVAISFTVETDGTLPTGRPLKDAIELVDAATAAGPVYYMINCAHPTHFADLLKSGEPWLDRIHGLRANASCMSHAELDEAEELDAGNPIELGNQYAALHQDLNKLHIYGGCCGTDQRHIEAILGAVKGLSV